MFQTGEPVALSKVARGKRGMGMSAWLNLSYSWLDFELCYLDRILFSQDFLSLLPCVFIHSNSGMIQIPSPGGYDKLIYKELAKDEYTEGANIKMDDGIKEDDLVVVKTYACGVNYADISIRWGLYESAKKFVGWPITPGFEFSGEIVSKGKNVTEFEIGQKVFGVSLFGAYSTRIRVPKHQIFPLPENLGENEAAGFLTVALTAWYGMFELARPRAEGWILVHSAAGGVGSMLVQLAKIHGCHVVGVVGGSHKVDLAKCLGKTKALISLLRIFDPRAAEIDIPGSWLVLYSLLRILVPELLAHRSWLGLVEEQVAVGGQDLIG